MLRRIAIAASLGLLLAACDDDAPPPPPRDLPPAAVPQPAVPGAPDETGSTATGSSSGSGEAAPAFEALAGSWEGAYEAKKGRVDVPAGVKDPGHAADDGKVASGPGLVKLTITATGDVSGKSEGALGKASVRGKIDGKMLRASFLPDDPLAPTAMTGVLVGPLKDGAIQAELRVAGPDALVVRQAVFAIKKK